MEFFRNLKEKHQALKKKIHNTRIPLSPTGRKIMAVVYFTTPIILGSLVMQLAFSQTDKNIGINGEKLKDLDTGSQLEASNKKQNENLEKMLATFKKQS